MFIGIRARIKKKKFSVLVRNGGHYKLGTRSSLFGTMCGSVILRGKTNVWRHKVILWLKQIKNVNKPKQPLDWSVRGLICKYVCVHVWAEIWLAVNSRKYRN